MTHIRPSQLGQDTPGTHGSHGSHAANPGHPAQAQPARALHRPRPPRAPRRLHLIAVALAAGAALAAQPGSAQTINVSQLVTGTHENLPASPGFPWPCGNACLQTSVSGVQFSNGYGSWPGSFAKTPWPAFYQAAAVSYAYAQDAPTLADAPAGTQYVGLPTGVMQRARMRFDTAPFSPASERRLDVQTFKSGNGASALSHAVRINTPPGPARLTYLRFKLPTLARDALPASQIGGPSGNEPISTRPERVQARSLVDVYVDGLPVWSSQSTRLLPQRYAPTLPGEILIEQGEALNGSDVTLFLGTLPGGSQRSVVMVMRSDLRVDAPTCHTVNRPLGDDERRCNTQYEALMLPSAVSASQLTHAPDVLVYTR